MLDERVGDLEAVVKELEEWTGELGMFCYSEAWSYFINYESGIQKLRLGGWQSVKLV